MRQRARESGAVRCWPVAVSATAHAVLLAGVAMLPTTSAGNGHTAAVTSRLAAVADLAPPPEVPDEELEVPEHELEAVEFEDDPFPEPPTFDAPHESSDRHASPVIGVSTTRFGPRRRRAIPAAAPPPRVVVPPPSIARPASPVHAEPPPVRAPAPTLAARLRPGAARPVYPDLARRRGYAGVVVLNVHVRADGTVSLVEIVESSGYDVLDQAAVDAAQSWRFDAATQGGAPVASVVRKPVRFSF